MFLFLDEFPDNQDVSVTKRGWTTVHCVRLTFRAPPDWTVTKAFNSE